MLRRTARLRKEYLYRKSLEDKEQQLAARKAAVRAALEEGKPIPTDIGGAAAATRLAQTLDLTDANTEQQYTHIDDEYAYAGLEDPQVVLTTSRNPSSRLLQFISEFRLLIPNCQKINRGGIILNDLIQMCRAKGTTDVIIVHEHRGEPNALIVSHLPHGPTAHFSLSGVCLRHDLCEKPPNMSEAPPHLIFHGCSSPLGVRISNILKYLFPPSSAASKRVHAFININNTLYFRHYTWAYTQHDHNNTVDQDGNNSSSSSNSSSNSSSSSSSSSKKRQLELTEIGPRFCLRPYKIELGTAEMRDLEKEWTIRPFLNNNKSSNLA